VEHGDRLTLVATYVVLALLGAAVGVWGAFLVPLRLFGHIEGLADVVGLVGTVLAGCLGGLGLRSAPAAVIPGVGWILSFLVLGYSPGGDVVIPGSLGNDHSVAIVGTLYLVSGFLGTLVSGVLVARLLRRFTSEPNGPRPQQ
jgi:hypothetical protein